MSSYIYEGHGLLLEVEDTDEFLDMIDSITGGAYESIEEFENEGYIGDWCSPDNVDAAYRDDEPVDGGFLLIRQDDDGGFQADLELLAEAFGTTPEHLVRDNECDFFVRCFQ